MDRNYGFNYEHPLILHERWGGELEQMRMEEDPALHLPPGASNPDRFWYVRDECVTPGPPGASPIYEYAPGVGELDYPTVMGTHTEAFAEEMGLTFEREDPVEPSIHPRFQLGPRESLSTMHWGINPNRSLYGMYDNDYSPHRSLLMEPVSVNPARRLGGGGGFEPWPEGAVDYISRRSLGLTELDTQWDSFWQMPGDHVTQQVIQDRENFIDVNSPGGTSESSWFYDDDYTSPSLFRDVGGAPHG